MDIATIAVTATLAGSLGLLIGRRISMAKMGVLRTSNANLRNTLVTRGEDIEHLAARCVDLRRKIMHLEPDAELGRKHRQQRDGALARAREANAARSAAKTAKAA